MGKRLPKCSNVNGTALIKTDPLLKPYTTQLRERFAHYRHFKTEIEKTGGVLGEISQGHRYFGFNHGQHEGKTGVWYREWAPGAEALALIGDFNDWSRDANPMSVDDWGVWHIFLPNNEYADRFTHSSLVKVHVISNLGGLDRIPAYIQRVVQESDAGFTGQYWAPQHPYQWQHRAPDFDIDAEGLRVYEAHIGMAQETEKVGTFAAFTQNILPRIAD